MNSTAIIIPNWNGLGEIEACIDSLKAQTSPVDIIVVDNGSVDGSKELVATKYPEIAILPQPVNLGFAGGVNVGIRYALKTGYENIGLFNSDATAEAVWSTEILKTLQERPEAGIVTGLLLHGDGQTIDSTGDWYSIWGLPFPRGRGVATSEADVAGEVFSASGGASIYRASLFNTIGLFDESFFAYYEDVDVSFRAQLAGYKVFYNPKAIAFHERGSASSRMNATKQTGATKVSGFTIYQTFKNLPLLYMKDVPLGLITTVGPRFYFAYWLMFGNAVKHGNGWPALKGALQSIVLKPQAYIERRRIQRTKTVPTSYIRSILWPDLPPDQTGIRKLRRLFTGKK